MTLARPLALVLLLSALPSAAPASWPAVLRPAPAWAGPPTDQLKSHVDRVLAILADPQLKGGNRTAERRAAIRAVADGIFDFREIAQRTLGRHWQARTPAEREEFSRLLAAILENAYITQIETYSGERIAYLGEALDGDLATVRTRIVTKQGTEIPVDYRLLQQGERWRAYDVLVEGISLVGNYRTQFNAILRRASYPELVARMKERVKDGAAPARRDPKLESVQPVSTGGPLRRQQSP
jgi:phospholipid transport system substrate-binding protein